MELRLLLSEYMVRGSCGRGRGAGVAKVILRRTFRSANQATSAPLVWRKPIVPRWPRYDVGRRCGMERGMQAGRERTDLFGLGVLEIVELPHADAVDSERSAENC